MSFNNIDESMLLSKQSNIFCSNDNNNLLGTINNKGRQSRFFEGEEKEDLTIQSQFLDIDLGINRQSRFLEEIKIVNKISNANNYNV